MSTTPNDFLLGGGNKSAFGRDDQVGRTVTGTIVSTEVRQQTDIATGALLTWDNGDPRMQLVIELQTELRDDNEDDGVRSLYVKGSKAAGSKSLHDAVRAAVQAAGAKGLEKGGTLTVSFIGTEPSKTRGYNDRKLWSATYTAPDHATVAADFLGTSAAPATPASVPVGQQLPIQAAPAPATAAPAAPAPAATPVEQAKALASLGMTAEQVAEQLGLDTTVAAILINS